MAILGPITSDRDKRSFGVIDLEWVPGRALDLPRNTRVEFAGMYGTCNIPLPTKDRQTEPLQLRLAGYYDEGLPEPDDELNEHVSAPRYECFESIEDLLGFVLTRENRGRWFYAHAGGLADMEFVLDVLLQEIKKSTSTDTSSYSVTPETNSKLKKRGIDRHEDFVAGTWQIRASFSGSSAIIIHVSRGKNAWHFIDSYWLLRDSLANIGRAIKVAKGETPEAVEWLGKRFNKPSFESLSGQEVVTFYREAPYKVLMSYNKVDCIILWKAIAAFETEILSLGGQLQQTIASTGMNLFRRAYLKRNIYTSERVNKVAEESYFASRVEVISRNCSDFRIYDINSSFPFSMTFPMPGGLSEISNKLPEDESEECIYIADVTIEVPDMDLPPVPYRMDNRVFFPVGKWRSWLTSTDIKLALHEGCKIHKVHEVYIFEPFYDLRGYARDIYAKRSDPSNSDFRRLVLKYLLNSLYGKYAEAMMKQEMLVNPEEIDRTNMQLLQPGVWLKEKEVPIAHRHVIISTHITALSRRTLYGYMKSCYKKGHKPYYCDTDSIATRAELPSNEYKLGALKLEKKMEWADFLAPKIYRGEGMELKKGQWSPIQMTKAKGFSLGKTRDEAWARFEKIAAGDRIGIQRMIRLRELYRSGLTSPVEILVIKALTFEMLSKRFHYPDGETRPWHMKELTSGDVYPKGFDFEPEIASRIDTTTRAMMEAVV